MAVKKGEEGSAVVRRFRNTATTRYFHPANVEFASFSDAGPAAQTACFPLPTRSSDMNFRSGRFQSHAGGQDGVATAASSKTPSSASGRYLWRIPILAWPRTGTSAAANPRGDGRNCPFLAQAQDHWYLVPCVHRVSPHPPCKPLHVRP